MSGTPKVHVLTTDLVTVNGLSLLGNGNLKILNGKSAYEIYVAGLGEGVTPLTEAEWILSLKGDLSPINSAIEDINNSLENKVEKVNGKGLSTNDLTNELLDSINSKKVKNVAGDNSNKTIKVTFTDDTEYDMGNVLKNYVSTDGGKINGPIIGTKEKAQVLVAGTLDLNEGNLFTKTVTSDTTFTLTNISAIPNVVQSFILEITNGGNFIVTWWNNIKWDSGKIPELTVDGVDILGFYTSDNGNTWRGVLLSKDSK